MKFLTAALFALLSLPALSSAHENVSVRVNTPYGDVSVRRASPRPVGRWEWRPVTTREADRVERVWVEKCRTRGRHGRVQKCKGEWKQRVVAGRETTTWQWVWVEPQPHRLARGW